MKLPERLLRLRGELSARLEDIEINMDKVRLISHETRADLRELRRELKDHLPALKLRLAISNGHRITAIDVAKVTSLVTVTVA